MNKTSDRMIKKIQKVQKINYDYQIPLWGIKINTDRKWKAERLKDKNRKAVRLTENKP